MRRQRAKPTPVPASAVGAMHRRTRKKKATPAASAVVIPFTEDEVLKPILKGPELRAFRGGAHVHVSDVVSQCPRRLAIAKKYGRPLCDQQIFDSLGVTFAMGDAIHDYIRTKVADRAADAIYANWSCPCKASTYHGTKANAAQVHGDCPKCGLPLDGHGEIVLLNEELNMTGSIDLSLIIGNALLITEIKSMTKTKWADLARPLPDHVIQVLFYWKFARDKNIAVHDKVSILYTQKEYQFHNPYKEFVLQPSKIISRLDDYVDDARTLAAVYADPTNAPLPARLECSSPTLQKAKDCDMSLLCFEVDR